MAIELIFLVYGPIWSASAMEDPGRLPGKSHQIYFERWYFNVCKSNAGFVGRTAAADTSKRSIAEQPRSVASPAGPMFAVEWSQDKAKPVN